MKKCVMVVFLATSLLPLAALAERPLTKDEMLNIFTDVTFDGVYLPKDSRFTAYGAPDGTLIIVQSNGDRSSGRNWSVNDKGQRCVDGGSRCFDVIDRGDGTYHQYENGKHMHTLSNFRKGNQL